MTTGTLVELSHTQMDSIVEAIREGGVVQGILKTWEHVLGHTLEDHEGDVEAWDYGIPEVQWKQLAQACIDLDGSAIGKVGTALDWMNSSPSGVSDDDPRFSK